MKQIENNFDLVQHIRRQREFSLKTFGPSPRTKGIIDHIQEELVEIEAQPNDIMEWVDVILLAIDGAWRVGHEPEQIAAAIKDKQRINEERNWPDWRECSQDESIGHVK